MKVLLIMWQQLSPIRYSLNTVDPLLATTAPHLALEYRLTHQQYFKGASFI